MAKSIITCLCVTLLAAAGARASDDPALYPAAQCAAFWLGFSDYAKRSPFLDYDPDDVNRSETFRDIALHLSPDRAAEIDARIASERPAMALLAEAVIYGGDAQSRTVFEKLTGRCERFADGYPEVTNRNQ